MGRINKGVTTDRSMPRRICSDSSICSVLPAARLGRLHLGGEVVEEQSCFDAVCTGVGAGADVVHEALHSVAIQGELGAEVDKPHAPVGKLAFFHRLAEQYIAAGMAGVEGNFLVKVHHDFAIPFEHLEKVAVTIKQRACDAQRGIVRLAAPDDLLKSRLVKRGARSADIKQLD